MPRPFLAPFALAVALAGPALAGPASAAEIVIPIRAQRTAVTWTLGAPLHTVHGVFPVGDGELRFDPATKAMTGEVAFDLAAGASGDAKRDANMRNDVLETAKFPIATFTSRSIAGTLAADGVSHVTLNGSLAIHGASHDLALPLDLVTHDGRVASGETRFTIPYVAWGMHDPSTFFLRVSNHVDVDVRLTASP